MHGQVAVTVVIGENQEDVRGLRHSISSKLESVLEGLYQNLGFGSKEIV